MIQDISTTVRSVLDERETLVKREKQLIRDLERVLPGLGYTLARIRDNGVTVQASDYRVGRREGADLSCTAATQAAVM